MKFLVGPEDWALLADKAPAALEVWVQRLGGPPGGLLAVLGALAPHRRRLIRRPDGLIEINDADRP